MIKRKNDFPIRIRIFYSNCINSAFLLSFISILHIKKENNIKHIF